MALSGKKTQAEIVKFFQDGSKVIQETIGNHASSLVSARGGYQVLIGGTGAKGTPIIVVSGNGQVWTGTVEANLQTLADGTHIIKNLK